jgi:chaperonin GroEL
VLAVVTKVDNDDQRFGLEIVRKTIQMPLRPIAEDAGEDGAVIAGKISDKDECNWGALTRRPASSRTWRG